MSLRLRAALREKWLRLGRPDSGFVAQLNHKRYRNGVVREGGRRRLRSDCFKQMCISAGIGETYTPKTLRDTYASQLLSCGVQALHVATQLGHDLAVCSRHYARWCGENGSRHKLQLRGQEVYADLLARLGESHHAPTTASDGDASVAEASA